METLEMVQPAIDFVVSCAAVSLPLVVVCGLVERLFNFLLGMVSGKERVKL